MDQSNPSFRLIDFKSYDIPSDKDDKYSQKEFCVQMFGLNEKGENASIKVSGIKPFFYVKVGTDWTQTDVKAFKNDILHTLSRVELLDNYKKYENGQRSFLKPSLNKDESCKEYIKRNFRTHESYHSKNILNFELVKKHKLYGFDNKTLHNFVKIVFINNSAFNKVKNLWFDRFEDKTSKFGFTQKLKTFNSRGFPTELYEAKLPPLLRFFHLKDISPSGWIALKNDNYQEIIKEHEKETICKYEYLVHYDNIISLKEKEDFVPLKICSFDIEASSSHGDFPMAIKSYKKLAGELQVLWTRNLEDISQMSPAEQKHLLKLQIYTAFNLLKEPCDGISKVFPKDDTIDANYIDIKFNSLINSSLKNLLYKKDDTLTQRDDFEEPDEDEITYRKNVWGLSVKYNNNKGTRYKFIDCLLDNIDVAKKVEILDGALSKIMPELEGDKVTFIGSTFIKMGESNPYLNHGICLGNCDAFDITNSDVEILCCEDEADVLTEWKEIIQREQPDIIIGYNIFGFDYKFMCDRAKETNCEHEFYAIGKNKNINCRRVEKEIRIASGTHELTYIDIDGIIQLDLYNYFRREVNLASYKLQDVASYFIGDSVSNATIIGTCEESKAFDYDKTLIKSKNLMGLQENNFVIFEVIGHSLDAYESGKKYKVIHIDEKKGEFIVEGSVTIPTDKKMRWGLGKDDVTPADLFHAFSDKGTDEDRTNIARYCFQDCNLVHHLNRKNDILTGMTEIASICFVPIDFIIMRGQGIKLLSFIAQKCSEKNTLMPVLEKKLDGGFEGAICLPPKRGFYHNKPVAVVDYSSLYPSCMISENISHDSKVWTEEYDLEGKLIKEEGNRDYDNLDGFKYVDIDYDTYDYIAPEGKTKLEKVKVGTKRCRFVQFPGDEKAIMPSILGELLGARKATRSLIKYKTLEFADGSTIDGLLSEDGDNFIVKNKYGKKVVAKDEVINIKDTFNDFMKNVFDQRQLGYKVTANSLYGQTGAKTSAFYEKDIAASTTATGRKLLVYGKKVIEGVFDNRVFETKHGKVLCKGDVIYGDTDSCFFIFNPRDEDGNKIVGKKALEITIELAILAGEIASKFLKKPHDLEYEKTFDPYFLFSKKRYVGILYEKNPNKGKRKAMGLVLKRRDNADIVKDIYGGNIDIFMKDGDVKKAIKFTKDFLQNIIKGNIDMKKLVISKALRDWYKVPESIAHKVLADRMGKRDPGNKPAVGSRIPYVYIQTDGKAKLQGDRIEHPDYIKENGLKPDYGFYITNQIMKPLLQLFGLVLEDIPQFKAKLSKFKRQLNTLRRKHSHDIDKMESAEDKLRNAEVKKIIFEDALRQANNIKNNQRTIQSFFM